MIIKDTNIVAYEQKINIVTGMIRIVDSAKSRVVNNEFSIFILLIS